MLRTRRLAFGDGIAALESDAGAISPRSVEQIVYTCPAGKRAIVRDIQVTNWGTHPTLSWSFYVISGGDFGTIASGTTTAEEVTTSRSLDAVLEPGDTLRFAADQAELQWYISGAELDILPL